MDMCFLVANPLSLISPILLVGVRSVTLVTLAWWRLVKGFFNFHVDLCLRVGVWTVAFLALPLRILTSLKRERTLEMQIHEMQAQLENLLWENNELEERLLRARKERKVMETMFEEIEEEHEKALSRIDFLENELHDLKEENLRLNEVQGKALLDYNACDDNVGNIREGIPLGSDCGVPWSSGRKGFGMTLSDMLMHEDSWADVAKGKPPGQSLLKLPSASPLPQMVSRNPIVDEALGRQRIVALYRSFFSAILSLLVGIIIWEAEGPCIPLVAALFIVVGMSLGSVVQFFSTIKNKPASDAVALLSINWFILGTLTSPSLPSIAKMLAPRAMRFADRLIIWLGFSP